MIPLTRSQLALVLEAGPVTVLHPKLIATPSLSCSGVCTPPRPGTVLGSQARGHGLLQAQLSFPSFGTYRAVTGRPRQ